MTDTSFSNDKESTKTRHLQHCKREKIENLPRTVERALNILEMIVTLQNSIGISELGRRVGLNKSTVYRIVQALSKKGYVIHDEQTKMYRSSYKILEIAGSLLKKNGFRGIARPHLEKLAKQTSHLVQLAVLEGDEIVFVDQVEGNRDVIQVRVQIGDRVPMHCTAAGKSILAFLVEPEREKFLQSHSLDIHTPNTVTTVNKLKKQLQAIKENGYSFCDSEYYRDVRAVGAPIFGMNRIVLGSVVVTVPAIHLKNNQIPYYAEMVKRTGRTISKELGCSDFEKGEGENIQFAADHFLKNLK